MTRDQFWSTLSQAISHADVDDRRYVQYSDDEVFEQLYAVLNSCSVDEVKGFIAQYQKLMEEANEHLLWGADSLINGVQSAEAFVQFREWLMMQGAAIFEQSVKNPDGLAAYLKGCTPGIAEFQGIWGAAVMVLDDHGVDLDTAVAQPTGVYRHLQFGWTPETLAVALPHLVALFPPQAR